MTTSPSPPTRDATTGRPRSDASAAVRPKGSFHSDGTTTIELRSIKRCTSTWSTHPVNSTLDLLENPHFRERGFWQTTGEYTHPGLSVRSSASELTLGAPAPSLGQDQRLIDDWLAIPIELPRTMKVGRAARDRSRFGADPGERLGEAFAGLKVADFSWVAVGASLSSRLMMVATGMR